MVPMHAEKRKVASHEPDEHPTSNIQRRTSNGSANPRSLVRSVFDVGCSMFFLGSGVSTREVFRGNLSRREREQSPTRSTLPGFRWTSSLRGFDVSFDAEAQRFW